MQIWDTAGQDKYKTITQNYYKNCNGAFVVYSIDSK
jgi:GTPase SAR1 family protein